MSNIEKYNRIFTNTFEIKEHQLEGLTYQSISAWDSVGHMSLISSLENAFDIMFDTMDVIDFNSYEKGKEILSKEEYGVDFNA
ncbi:MAG: acyl carrier protein [Christensenellales bacterium]|jgi:acyl carrier protein